MEVPMALATRLLLVVGLYPGIAKSDILFEDHFESGASPEWVSVKPSQYVEDGWFHFHDAVPDFYRDSAAFVHNGDPGWTDYTLSLKVDPLLNLDPFRFDDVVVSAVSEPSTLGLICMGLLWIVGCRYSVPMRRGVFKLVH